MVDSRLRADTRNSKIKKKKKKAAPVGRVKKTGKR